MNKFLIFVVLACFTFGYTVYEALKLESKLASSQVNQTGTVIKVLPDNLTFSSLIDDGPFVLNDITSNGNHIIIHFWATWCAPCEVEFPDLVEMINKNSNRNDVKIVLIAVNDNKVKINKFLSQFKIESSNVVLLTDDNSELQKLGTYKLPESFVFSKDNHIVQKLSGKQDWTK